MLDEAAAVGGCTGFRVQPHFESREGTDGTEPSLSRDEHNSTQVREPEPKGIHPPPVAKVADDDEKEASHDKRDNGEVQRNHDIRK